MPSNRHSYMVLAIFCVCALAICAILSWRNQEKKDRLLRQYAEFSMPQTSKGSTPQRTEKYFSDFPAPSTGGRTAATEPRKNLSPPGRAC